MVIGSHPRAVFPCAVAAVPTKASACTISREILDKSLGDKKQAVSALMLPYQESTYDRGLNNYQYYFGGSLL